MTKHLRPWTAAKLAIAAFSVLFTLMNAAHAQEGDVIGSFEITGYEVQGNTLLPAAAVEQMLKPYTGKARTFSAVREAKQALESAYHQKGHSLVHVVLPEQELNHGVVKLVVLEGKIGKISVSGNAFHSETNIRNSVPALQSGTELDIQDVSDQLRLANENPSKKTTMELQSATQDGVVDAQLKVTDDKPWLASITADNSGQDSSGRNHVTVEYQNAGLGGTDHVLSMQYTTSTEDPGEMHVYGIGYHIPLYALGDSFDMYANYSDVNSGMVTAGIFDLAVSGKGTVVGTRYNHTLARMGAYDSKLTFGLDYKAYQNDVTLAGAPLGNDVTVHPLSATYSGNWSQGDNSVALYASGIRNIPGGSNGSSADFTEARSGATADYSIFRYGASYQRLLPAEWQLRLALTGQVTSDALVPGEQFGAGGATTVRGFMEREISDDQGRVANAELYTPNLCSGTGVADMHCRLLTFYDDGYVSHNHGLPGELAQQSIASAGLGIRVDVQRYMSLVLDVARVTDASELTAQGTYRAHFKLVLSY